ncbi:hypothetical protein B0H10DRAFT_2394097 [Mycena sp. CBHHK59/15]|nr:hypothetical protein B0H10DRAFT_2394097 [Mycena sp. CBHHK59/15]
MALPEELASERPYRSRKSRPCDRCRSRKQRCITKPSGTCLNCQISAVTCTFDSPAAADLPRPRNKKAESKPKSFTAPNIITDSGSSRTVSQPYTSASSGSYLSSSTSPISLVTSSSVKLERHSPLRPDVISPLTSPGLELGGVFSNIVFAWDPPIVGRSMSEASTSNPSDEDLRALDSDADDDFEPHYVGETAERDALVLSALAAVHSSSRNGTTPPQSSPFRVRQVSTNQAEPVFFLFERTRPYGEDTLLASGRNCCADMLRHLVAEAWKITTSTNRAHARSARLSTIQANLLDLDGRPSLNPTGNSMLLGQTIAAGRLMGLHLDCSTWSIPKWEKDIRNRLWWALLQQDKWFGICVLAQRHSLTVISSYIHHTDWDVPLPPFDTTSEPASFTFFALCELTVILDRILRQLHVVRPSYGASNTRDKLTAVSSFGLDLDAWKHRLDSMGRSFNGYLPPGFRSLHLSYLAVALLLVRSVLDLDLPLTAAQSAHESALKVTEEMVAFTASLTADDLRGYFTTHSAFHFSTCLILLVRLVLQADLSDQSDAAVWQRTLHQLRIFISALSNAKRTVPSFELGDLALARARHLIPLLAKNIPELAIALEPFWQVFSHFISISCLTLLSSVPPEESVAESYSASSHPGGVVWPDNAPGLDAFFPEVTQPDWVSFRDYIHTPYSQMLNGNSSYGLH